MSLKPGRKRYSVTRDAKGFWIVTPDYSGSVFTYQTPAKAQRVADGMNAEEDDYTRQKYAPKQEAA